MLDRYLNPRLLGIIAAAFVASWIVQGATYAILREVSPATGSAGRIEKELRFAKSDRFVVYLSPAQNAGLLAVQGMHNLLGLATVGVFLGLAFNWAGTEERAGRRPK